ncbi:MAG: (E)-4-hydroxy-3-methylbut-2-enyl-diphosphate synthase [Bacteroidales bacterium]|nr:(E)-4-hydroxy-3-methylbut-2-enyl-diphosphate synthase [Bacteroidales bacterium]
MQNYTQDYFSYHRRETIEVKVGDIGIGGQNPIRIQSMTNVNTMDTQHCVEQSVRMIESGCEMIRITAPGIAEANNLKEIKKQLRQQGYHVPLIADVHFNPKVAEVAAEIVEKVRINPGNYADKKQFKQLYFSDTEYQQEQERIAERLYPLLKICKTNGTAIRIGTNHGSLSDRILSRYGNTPQGMAVSAMEYVSICNSFGFHQLVLSMKASDVRIMVQSVRYLVSMLNEKQWHYPIHLGVTEAGNGEYGRIKSAAGIGALLNDGIGDTIRVSLTEKPENELGFADILAHLNDKTQQKPIENNQQITYNPYNYQKRETINIGKIGGHARPIVVSDYALKSQEDVTAQELASVLIVNISENESVISVRKLVQSRQQQPIVLKRAYTQANWQEFMAQATADIATLGVDGLLDGVLISNPHFSAEKIYHLSLQILQACGLRYSRAEFISCPSCGRTQYDIERVAMEVQQKTSHLQGLKIGIMGCIVNGPGEMADADYGVVGSGKQKVCLYKGQQQVARNIPQEKACQALIDLIKQHGDWKEK